MPAAEYQPEEEERKALELLSDTPESDKAFKTSQVWAFLGLNVGISTTYYKWVLRHHRCTLQYRVWAQSAKTAIDPRLPLNQFIEEVDKMLLANSFDKWLEFRDFQAPQSLKMRGYNKASALFSHRRSKITVDVVHQGVGAFRSLASYNKKRFDTRTIRPVYKNLVTAVKSFYSS